MLSPGAVPLILTEDRDFSVQVRGGTAHVLSTRSWLVGLANAGAISDAETVIAQIASHGRTLSRLVTDIPAEAGEARSDWIGLVRPGRS